MAITTTPGPTANGHLTVVEADNYHSSRLHNEKWLNATSDKKEAAIKWATRILNTLNWKGTKTQQDNANEWPREGVYDSNGYIIPNSVTPSQVKNACAELSFHLIDSDTTVEKSGPEFTTVEVGGLKIDYKGAKSAAPGIAPVPHSVMVMINGLIIPKRNTLVRV